MKHLFSFLCAACIGLCTMTSSAAESSPDIQKYSASKDLTIYAIRDTAQKMPASMFSDPTKSSDLKKLDSKKEYDASVNVFLVNTQGKYVLIDGGNYSEKGELVKKLAKIDVKPKMVNLVLVTHCHPDHVGGLVDAKGEPVFPSAVVNMSYEEWKYWNGVDEKKRNAAVNKFLSAYRGKIRPLNAGEPTLYGVSLQQAYGHTPGHAIYKIGKFRFVGDIVHAADLQFKYPEYCASFDNDKKQSVISRLTVFRQTATDGATIFGAHIPFPGYGSIVQPEKGKDSFQFIPASAPAKKP